MFKNLQSRAEIAHLSPMRAVLVLLALSFVSCSTTNALAPESKPPSVAADAVSVENLLRWPLEGAAGADKVVAGLRQAIKVRELQIPGQFSGQGPAKLADGYSLTFASFTPEFQDISVGIATEPCFPTERAVAATGATASPITRDVHGADVGQSFDIVRNGLRVSFTTTPMTYKCIDTIYVRRER